MERAYFRQFASRGVFVEQQVRIHIASLKMDKLRLKKAEKAAFAGVHGDCSVLHQAGHVERYAHFPWRYFRA
jgi:hypothetical protein